MDTATTKIIIVDDHPLFRGAMAQALGSDDGSIDIIEAGGFGELQSAIGEHHDIDLVLLDLAMPGVSGFSGLLTLQAEHPDLPVMIVSASDDPSTVSRAMALGAAGFVPKSSSIDTIRVAIEAVLRGDTWQPENSAGVSESDPEIEDILKRVTTLTPQQKRVLSMISQGLLNKQIAYELDVSEATIKAHVSAVLQKMNVDSRTQAVIRLSRLGADPLSLA
ncbi:response regulator [Pseudahrensia aquimaris]|uniref:Response regulator n=1 Tax=Pseudahrensia aquimaris TaxID=744461 RepID=A0ABW3FH26_9HYPH